MTISDELVRNSALCKSDWNFSWKDRPRSQMTKDSRNEVRENKNGDFSQKKIKVKLLKISGKISFKRLSVKKYSLHWCTFLQFFFFNVAERSLCRDKKNVSLCKLKQRENDKCPDFYSKTIHQKYRFSTICSVNSSTYSWGTIIYKTLKLKI